MAWNEATFSPWTCMKQNTSERSHIAVVCMVVVWYVKMHGCELFVLYPAVPTPLFTHMGHEEEFPGAHILVHSWHPHLTNTVLSVDSEGSLHAWQWRQQ